MKHISTCLLLFRLCFVLPAQTTDLYTELPPLPEAVTNNAVASAMVQDTPYLFSFAGIDSTKIWSGIHLRTWQLNTISGHWSALPPIPDPEGGKIAASASTVGGLIYVIGGYHVAADGTETSSAKVHRFDPASKTWLEDAADIPIPIDDQVQVVWRDSLIFVVTGWSNTQNVPAVQVFNPALNMWSVGTSLPNNNNYKTFGATGVIVGDTLYYTGGASSSFNFPATSFFRKGYINPDNPLDISWSGYSIPAAKGYRMAAGSMAGEPVWVGGSDVTYNYDGIAYNGTSGVAALRRRKKYSPSTGQLLNEITADLPAIMDIRSAAQLDSNTLVTVGGMESGQQVSRRVFAYSWLPTVSIAEPVSEDKVLISPNPASKYVDITVSGAFTARLFAASGYLIGVREGIDTHRWATYELPSGVYFLQILKNGRMLKTQKITLE